MIYVFVFGYLPCGCHIDLSYTQLLFWMIYNKKSAVGGHVGRDAEISKSGTLTLSHAKFYQARDAEVFVIGLLISDVWKVNNTEEC